MAARIEQVSVARHKYLPGPRFRQVTAPLLPLRRTPQNSIAVPAISALFASHFANGVFPGLQVRIFVVLFALLFLPLAE